jgi:hypothetical protein
MAAIIAAGKQKRQCHQAGDAALLEISAGFAVPAR